MNFTVPDANSYPHEECVEVSRRWKHLEYHLDESRTDVLESLADEFEQMTLDDYLT